MHALGFINAIGKARIPICGELNARIIRDALLPGTAQEGYEPVADIPARPPTLCAGCPHRGFFYALTKYLNKSIVPIGDIGCYTLGINAPLNALDATICMGALQRRLKCRGIRASPSAAWAIPRFSTAA